MGTYTKHSCHIWVNHSRTFSHSSYSDGHSPDLIFQKELVVKESYYSRIKSKGRKLQVIQEIQTSVWTATLLLTRSVVVMATAAEFALLNGKGYWVRDSKASQQMLVTYHDNFYLKDCAMILLINTPEWTTTENSQVEAVNLEVPPA